MRLDPTNLVLRHHADRNVFLVESGGLALGTLTYSCLGESAIAIDHVVVIPDAQGGRIARVLVEGAIEWASAQRLDVVPVCRYARALVERSLNLSRRNKHVEG